MLRAPCSLFIFYTQYIYNNIPVLVQDYKKTTLHISSLITVSDVFLYTMVSHKCSECFLVTERSYNLRRHLKRKMFTVLLRKQWHISIHPLQSDIWEMDYLDAHEYRNQMMDCIPKNWIVYRVLLTIISTVRIDLFNSWLPASMHNRSGIKQHLFWMLLRNTISTSCRLLRLWSSRRMLQFGPSPPTDSCASTGRVRRRCLRTRPVEKKHHRPITPWFNAVCRAEKRRSRCLERVYRRTRLARDRTMWVNQLRSAQLVYQRVQHEYWQMLITNSSGNARKLWNSLSSVMGRNRGSSVNLDLRPMPSQSSSATRWMMFVRPPLVRRNLNRRYSMTIH